MSDMTLTLCPVCHPLSYYGGKSGGEEIQGKIMCESCKYALDGMLLYMATLTGDSAYITDRSPYIPRDHKKIIDAFLAGSGIQFHTVKDGCDWKIEMKIAINMKNKQLNEIDRLTNQLSAETEVNRVAAITLVKKTNLIDELTKEKSSYFRTGIRQAEIIGRKNAEIAALKSALLPFTQLKALKESGE